MKESYGEYLANRIGLESYAEDGDILGVASTIQEKQLAAENQLFYRLDCI
jgi:hypothetical protein